MKAKNVIAFLLVVAIIVACAYVAAFDVTIGSFRVPSTFDKELGIRQGLDLVGGSVIVFEPDVEDLSKVTSEDMDAAETIIRKRLDDQNFGEATLSRQGNTGIRVEIPGVDDPQAAVAMIGATAKLEFLDADGKLSDMVGYYFHTTGLARGLYVGTIDGATHYFDAKGVMQKNYKYYDKTNDKYYMFNANGIGSEVTKEEYEERYQVETCDFYIAAYNAAGMAYAGRYRVSLTDVNNSTVYFPCDPFGNYPLQLSWE